MHPFHLISVLFFNLIIGAWRSLVAHLLWEQGVEGSNPFAPTILSSIKSKNYRLSPPVKKQP